MKLCMLRSHNRNCDLIGVNYDPILRQNNRLSNYRFNSALITFLGDLTYLNCLPLLT